MIVTEFTTGPVLLMMTETLDASLSEPSSTSYEQVTESPGETIDGFRSILCDEPMVAPVVSLVQVYPSCNMSPSSSVMPTLQVTVSKLFGVLGVMEWVISSALFSRVLI